MTDEDPAAGEEEAQSLRETLAGVEPTTGSTTRRPRDPGPRPLIDPGDGGNYRPTLDPADFVDGIDNLYLPLRPGARWVYEGVVDGEHNRIELAMTTERKEIMGISAVGVSDTNYLRRRAGRGIPRLVRARPRRQHLVPRRGHQGIRERQAVQTDGGDGARNLIEYTPGR